jgi:RNA polymerase sigma-70 factor (sigma-E family)
VSYGYDREEARVPSDRDHEFTEYVAARQAALRRTAYLLCHDWHQADDLLQTALAKLYVAWRRVRAADDIDAYVRTVLLRVFLDEKRRFWRREVPVGVPAAELAPRPPGPHPSGPHPSGPEDRLVLLAALATLPRQQRAVVVLRCWEDLSVAQTADALGCSEGAVKAHRPRGLAALRRVLPADPRSAHLEGEAR